MFGRILPALGLMMCLSTFYYAWLAYRLAQKTGRNDVCALPSGVSVPHMFIVTFVIMLPITLKTGDPDQGLGGGPGLGVLPELHPDDRRLHRALSSARSRRARRCSARWPASPITFISMRPALEMFMTPVIGLVCFAIILVSWFGGVKYPQGHSGRPRRHRGRHAHRLGLEPVRARARRHEPRRASAMPFANFGFSVPLPAFGHVFSGFEFLGIILVTAIPFGIYDLVEAMDNVESAEAAGDDYPTTRVLTADGVVSLIGCLMGNPFINAVYIGHPGWKAMGGRIGYSAATGVMVIVLSWFGIISVMLGADPGGRDLADPALHRHADRRAGVPDHADQARAGDRAGADAASRGLGQAADRHHARLDARPRRPSAVSPPTRSMRSRPLRSPRCRSRACSITGSK